MDIVLYNTLKRDKEKFYTIEPGKVKLYTCGPTVYHYAHIGNLRTYVFEDILVRSLRYFGYEVNHVMNITDVGHLVSDRDEGEDKMEKGARREGKSAWEIAEFYTKVFFRDLERLHILPPTHIPKATDHIVEMIAIIQELERKGITYKTSDGIYYDTTKFPTYGNLAKLDIENLEAGKRVALREKQNPTDFALWKFSTPQEKRQMEWDSPWGRGFPGWHIECSAMSMKYLGETLDIHCGGKDHIPVHHTNEIAQSEAATNKIFSHFWMHGEFLTEDKGKISKSEGTVLNLDYVVAQGFDPMAYRFLLLQAHYRSELNFHWDALKSAASGLEGIFQRVEQWPEVETLLSLDSVTSKKIQENFQRALADDLNTPMAMAYFFDMLKSTEINYPEKWFLLRDFEQIFALGIENTLKTRKQENLLPENVLALIQDRDLARKNKNWAESDKIRRDLETLGYTVKDTSEGTKVKK